MTLNNSEGYVYVFFAILFRPLGLVLSLVRCNCIPLFYAYDANGNLTQVLTTRMEPTAQGQSQGQTDTREVMLSNRRLLWDEENRLAAVSDNGYVGT
jgi:YD repeat-containing protein